MSKSVASGAEHPEREALARLTKSVERLLEERVNQNTRIGELEGQITRLKKGDVDSTELRNRLEAAESRNRDLLKRIEEGREGVERLLSRLQFLEDQR
jgi:predicted RNase H-like nuclease (RuvC/YqgF family)